LGTFITEGALDKSSKSGTYKVIDKTLHFVDWIAFKKNK